MRALKFPVEILKRPLTDRNFEMRVLEMQVPFGFAQDDKLWGRMLVPAELRGA
jgi:hypothetical protein